VSLEIYIEKMLGPTGSVGERSSLAYSPNWYIMFSSLLSDIEIPLLVWNTDTLNYLLNELRKLEESLDFARQLRSLLPLSLASLLGSSLDLSLSSPSSDTKRGIRATWMSTMFPFTLLATVTLSFATSSFIALLMSWKSGEVNIFRVHCPMRGVSSNTLRPLAKKQLVSLTPIRALLMARISLFSELCISCT
jgi:hypothetical protein